MGITGLIPFLNKASKKSNVSQFSGGTAAIDAYCWLHKGAFSCADKLIMGQSSDAYVKYCMKLVHMLIAAKIKPILVFDGRHLPAKADTEVKRREQREGNKRRAAELMRMGKDSEGKNLLRRSLDISHEMALEVIKQCQIENVDCIVAPYEADAQLAYLNISGIADVVITEDSDLTLFGCNKIFFKMDINGNGLLVEQDRLHLAMGVRAEHFDMDKFRYMCILSGCDYLPSLPGIGLSKACKFILKSTEADIYNSLTRIASYLNMKSLVVTKEYRDSFLRAFVTFKHQLVYCPIKRKQVRLYSPPPHVTDEQLRHAGVELDEDLAWQLALGNYDPFSLKKLHDFDPDNRPKRPLRTNSWTDKEIVKHPSIWSQSFTKEKSTAPKTKSSTPVFPNTSGQVMTLKTTIIQKTTTRKRNFEEFEEEEDMLAIYGSVPKKIESAELKSPSKTKPEDKDEEDKSKSPVISRRIRNPFVKGADGVSPSLLTRTRRRTRLNVFTPTVIDNTVVAQSKFFSSASSTSEGTDSESKSSEFKSITDDSSTEEAKVKGKENLDVNLPSATREDTEKEYFEEVEEKSPNSKEDEISADFPEGSGSADIMDTSIGLSSVHIHSQSESQGDKSPGNSEMSENIESMATQELLNDMDTRSSSPDSELEYSVDSSSIDHVRPSLFKWENTKRLEVKRLESSNKSKLVQPSKKRIVRNSTSAKKSLSSQGQQSLLNMFGFQKKASLKH
ncbi:exonuclease 1 [Belonocnema kinseyi]|uniref:exonuclease 1 n=1 Tax=Belonocnema kinseyi TaxID=2817044 RepID=UPI00143DCB70|nr:exonuclease 1 [Belonocnema kinseyi]